jgi:hypothetical protein
MTTPRGTIQLGNSVEQRELFLLKFPDVERIDVIDMHEAFDKFDSNKSGQIEERNVQLLFADLGVHKTMQELRAMLSAIDFTVGRKISFMELCCASFGKSFADLMDHTDPVAVANAKAAAEKARLVEEEIQRVREAEEAAAKEAQDKIEAESKLVNSSVLVCFFFI